MILDPATYRILYMNPAMRQAIGAGLDETFSDKRCYEALAGRDTPCDTCRNSSLSRTRVVCWNRRWNGEHMLLNRDFLIPWHGNTAVMSVGIPISEYIRLAAGGNTLLLQENGTNEAIESGLSQADPEAGIQATLRGIAKSLRAERVLIMENKPGGGAVSCTHEWCREGLIPARSEMKSIVNRKLSPLVQGFSDRRVVLIPDYPAFVRKNPAMGIPIPDIKNVISGQLLIGGEPMGFTLVINSAQETFYSASLLLLTLTDFLAVLLRCESQARRLQEDGFTDGMTGVGSRRALAGLPKAYDGRRSFAVLVCDILSLDGVNEVAGMAAGDRLLKKTADTLARFADRGMIFRIDGDEFLLAEYDMDEDGAKLLAQRLQEETKAQDIPLTIGYAIHEQGPLDLDDLMNRAEHARLQARRYAVVEEKAGSDDKVILHGGEHLPGAKPSVALKDIPVLLFCREDPGGEHGIAVVDKDLDGAVIQKDPEVGKTGQVPGSCLSLRLVEAVCHAGAVYRKDLFLTVPGDPEAAAVIRLCKEGEGKIPASAQDLEIRRGGKRIRLRGNRLAAKELKLFDRCLDQAPSPHA